MLPCIQMISMSHVRFNLSSVFKRIIEEDLEIVSYVDNQWLFIPCSHTIPGLSQQKIPFKNDTDLLIRAFRSILSHYESESP